MTEQFLWQSLAVFWVVVCFFKVGAMTKRIPMTTRTWWELAQGGALAVLAFGLMTEFRGCRHIGTPSLDTDAALGLGGSLVVLLKPVQQWLNG